MVSKKKPVGRPPKAAKERKRNVLSIRARDSLRADLARSAEASGRSVSEEAEYRLELSFSDERLFGVHAPRGLTMLMASAFFFAGRQAAKLNSVPETRWLQDPGCYGEAMAGVLRALLIGHPETDPETMRLRLGALIGRMQSIALTHAGRQQTNAR